MRVRLLGGFRVSVGARTVEEGGWRLRKAANLVKLLALAPGHRMHRERATDLLWPDLRRQAAANNLYQVLHAARRAFEADPKATARYLDSRGEQLVLCPDAELWVDVEAFEEAAKAARRYHKPTAYRAALDLYAGELLPGHPYEDWAEGRREELRRLFLSLLAELAALHEERGEYGAAVEALRRAVAEEPTHEEAHLGLMRLCALSGRRVEALAQYERLEEVLSRELDTEPGVSSRRLYEEIASGRFPQTSPSHAGSGPEEAAGGHNNLPAARISFVGRERERAEVKRALSMTRLLTLTGAGGSGKTRLAVEVARDLVGAYPDGVWLVELAPLSDPALVPQAVARTLEVREQPDVPLAATLVDALRRKQMLLVLDNCEHLIDACARLMDTLLGSGSRSRVLATSREALGVAGEANWPVPSLTVPAACDLPAIESLTRYEAVYLFVDRARSKLAAFHLTPQNARAVAEVCKKLDGIPLAIELAAARVTVLAVEQIAEKLEDPLKLLTAGGRTAPPRHRTLRATLEWSYDLLSEQERALFDRLSVFAGGWTLDAAEAVGAGHGVRAADVLELLSRLVDKSLVVAQERDGEARYRLLETVRQYGREKLLESGEAETARRHHASFFLTLAEEVEPKINGADRGAWLAYLEAEHDNLRAALRWSAETGEAETGLRLAGALWQFWFHRGYGSEARGWLEGALGRAESAGASARTVARAKALTGAGTMAWEQGDRAAARSQLEESVSLWRELEDEQGLALALQLLSVEMLSHGEHAVARSLAEESVAMFQRMETDAFGLAISLAALGIIVVSQGDYAPGSSLLEESIAISREAGDDWALSLPLRNLAVAAFKQGDYDRAAVLLEESLIVLRDLGEKQFITRSLDYLAAVASVQGAHARVARLFGAGEALRGAVGASVLPFYRADYERGVDAARAGLDEQSFAEAWARGRAMTLEEAVGYALRAGETSTPPSAPMPRKARGCESAENLTRREEEVAGLVARRLTNRQIAQKLSLSERTVENHVRNILKKLHLSSRSEVAAWIEEQRS